MIFVMFGHNEETIIIDSEEILTRRFSNSNKETSFTSLEINNHWDFRIFRLQVLILFMSNFLFQPTLLVSSSAHFFFVAIALSPTIKMILVQEKYYELFIIINHLFCRRSSYMDIKQFFIIDLLSFVPKQILNSE